MALSDHPCLTFWQELLATYPDAKVILTVRDNVDVWYDSVMATIWPIVEKRIDPKAGVLRKIWRSFLDATPFEKMIEYVHCNPQGMYYEFPARGKQFYREHNEKVCSMVPEDKLLVYNVKQGWGPLCEFLGYEIPEWPFPRVNEKSVFIAHQEKMDVALNLMVAKNIAKFFAPALAVGLGIWYAFKRR